MNQKFELTSLERKKIIDKLPDITIRMVMDLYNTTFTQSRFRISSVVIDNGAFSIKESDAEKKQKSPFNANGEAWTDFKHEASGVGAFQLLSYLEGIDFEDRDLALYKIKEYFLDEKYELDNSKISSGKVSFTAAYSLSGKSNNPLGDDNREFEAPPRYDEYLELGINYLNGKRGIPIELLKRTMDYEEGKIYVTKNFDGDKRVVFVSRLNSEERSIDSGYDNYAFKGTGNRGNIKKISGFEVAADDNALTYETIVEDGEEYEMIKKGTGYFALTEGAIDALSYNALFPDRFVTSLNGCGNFTLAYLKTTGYLDAKNDISIRVAFDNDEAGDIAAQKLFNAIYVRMILCKKYEGLLKQKYKHLIEEYGEDGWKKAVDEWILKEEIDFPVKNSPHTLFFNNPFYQKNGYPIYSKKEHIENQVYIDNYGNEKVYQRKILDKQYTPTGEIGLPTIEFRISQELADLLNIKEKKCEIHVKEDNFYKVTDTMLVREKPFSEKDWNETLIKQGISYLYRYSECYNNNFKNEKGEISFPQIDDTKSEISFYRNRNIKCENIKKYFLDTEQQIVLEEKVKEIKDVIKPINNASFEEYLVNFNQRKNMFLQFDELFEQNMSKRTTLEEKINKTLKQEEQKEREVKCEEQNVKQEEKNTKQENNKNYSKILFGQKNKMIQEQKNEKLNIKEAFKKAELIEEDKKVVELNASLTKPVNIVDKNIKISEKEDEEKNIIVEQAIENQKNKQNEVLKKYENLDQFDDLNPPPLDYNDNYINEMAMYENNQCEQDMQAEAEFYYYQQLEAEEKNNFSSSPKLK